MSSGRRHGASSIGSLVPLVMLDCDRFLLSAYLRHFAIGLIDLLDDQRAGPPQNNDERLITSERYAAVGQFPEAQSNSCRGDDIPSTVGTLVNGPAAAILAAGTRLFPGRSVRAGGRRITVNLAHVHTQQADRRTLGRDDDREDPLDAAPIWVPLGKAVLRSAPTAHPARPGASTCKSLLSTAR